MSLYRLLKKVERNQRRVYTQPPPNIVAPLKEYTIAAGVITLTGYDKIRFITVDTESDAGTDDLTYIYGGTVGDILICTQADTSRDVTLIDQTGNLRLAGNFTIDTVANTITLIYTSWNTWLEITRSSN